MAVTNPVIVHRARTNVVTMDLGFDISADTFTSEIRAEPEVTSALLATWTVSFETDGTDGILVLELDDVDAGQVTVDSGYMDIKRVSAGEPLPVFDRPLEVEFRGVVTA
jgi:hypothetical protein